jgi:putative SOS response-associated peptidase YedK
MCGRFYTVKSIKTLVRHYFPPELADMICEQLDQMQRDIEWREQNYDVRPTTKVLAFVGNEDAEVEPRLLKWGHIPSRYNKVKSPLFNAKGESLADKATWSKPWRTQRCLVPAQGFFEWTGEKGAKQPWAFQRADGDGLLFAGLWRRDDEVDWCSIVTAEASPWMSRWHDREPIIVRPDDVVRWLFDEDPPEDLLHAAAKGELEAFPCESPKADQPPKPAPGQQSLGFG